MVRMLFAKLVLVMISLWFSEEVCAEGFTNINQCVNICLTDDVLSHFPSNSTSSAQNSVFTFIKGSVKGDLRTFVEPFSVEKRSSEFGISDLDNVSISASNEFSTLMTSISNCETRVVSYSETTNNGIVKAEVMLRRQGVGYNHIEVAHLNIALTNNCWQIINWDVDE